MHRLHALAVALVLGAAVVLGVLAATRAAGLATPQAASAQPAGAALASRSRQLDRAEAALRARLTRRPPALPPLPPGPQRRTAAAAATAPQRVVYVRPAPRVLTTHRRDGEDDDRPGAAEQERGDGGGFDD